MLPPPGNCRPDSLAAIGDWIHSVLMKGSFSGQFRETLRNFGTIPLMVPLPGPAGRGGPHGKQLPSPKLELGKIKKPSDVLPFREVKPPGWDERRFSFSTAAKYTHKRRHPEEDECERLHRKARLLLRDYAEWSELVDRVQARGGPFQQFLDEYRNDEPDVEKLREYAVPIEHLLWIWQEVDLEAQAFSYEVHHGKEPILEDWMRPPR
jgi:hypothetical protein